MEEHGIAHALLLSPPMAQGTSPSLTAKSSVSARGAETSCSQSSPSSREGQAVRDALTLAKSQGGLVKGFKIWLGYTRVFARDEVFAPLYDYAEEHGLPVLFHTGDTATSTGSLSHAHPLTLDEVANEREGLRMVDLPSRQSLDPRYGRAALQAPERVHRHLGTGGREEALHEGIHADDGPEDQRGRLLRRREPRSSSSGQTIRSRLSRKASRSSRCSR